MLKPLNIVSKPSKHFNSPINPLKGPNNTQDQILALTRSPTFAAPLAAAKVSGTAFTAAFV